MRLRPLLLAAAAVLAYDLPLLTMRGLALRSDGFLQDYPVEAALAAALSNGTLPFWTPGIQAGFPLLAQGQPGALYPFNTLLFGILPTPVAHNAVVVLHHLLALIFTFCWGRALGLAAGVSAWIGLVFVFTLPWLGGATAPLETVTWIPLSLAIAERYARRGPARSAWLIAPVIAVQWLAGFPQLAFYGTAASSAYLCARLWTEGAPDPLRRAGAWALASMLGILLAAPQLLSSYELARHSIRAGGIESSFMAQHSFFPGALLTLLAPSTRAFFNAAGLGWGVYCGVLPLVLALVASVERPRPRWFGPLLFITLGALLVAFGHYGPLFPLLEALPGLSYFRASSRALVLVQLGVLALFALGWERLSAGSIRRLGRCLAAAAAVLLGLVVAHPIITALRPHLMERARQIVRSQILPDPYHLQPMAYYEEKIAHLYGVLLDSLSLRNPDLLIPLAIALSGWLLCVRWPLLIMRHGSAAFGLLILLDLLVHAGGLFPARAASIVTEAPPIIRVLRREIAASPCRVLSVIDAQSVRPRSDRLSLLRPNHNLVFDVPVTGIYFALAFAEYYRLVRPLGMIDLGFGYEPKEAKDIESNRGLLNLLNACLVLSRVELAGLLPIAESDGVRLYRNQSALPRAFLVDELEPLSSRDEASRWLESNPDRIGRVAIVPTSPPSKLQQGSAARSRLRWLESAATRLTLEVDAAGPVLLVVTDTHYPGWRATVGGQAAHIHEAYGVFRGVVVPTGRHRVVFSYHPRPFWIGLGIAGVAAAVLLSWGAWGLSRTHWRRAARLRQDSSGKPSPQAHARQFGTRREGTASPAARADSPDTG